MLVTHSGHWAGAPAPAAQLVQAAETALEQSMRVYVYTCSDASACVAYHHIITSSHHHIITSSHHIITSPDHVATDAGGGDCHRKAAAASRQSYFGEANFSLCVSVAACMRVCACLCVCMRLCVFLMTGLSCLADASTRRRAIRGPSNPTIPSIL